MLRFTELLAALAVVGGHHAGEAQRDPGRRDLSHTQAAGASALLQSLAPAKLLFCAYGKGPGGGGDTTFAVVVVEVDSPTQLPTASITNFALLNAAGVRTQFTTVVKLEEFFAPLDSTMNGMMAPYLNPGGPLSPGGVRPWLGTLPKGVIRLRIRAAHTGNLVRPASCRVTVGPYSVEGPVNGAWPR